MNIQGTIEIGIGIGAGILPESTIASQTTVTTSASWLLTSDTARFSGQQFIPNATKTVVAINLRHYDTIAATGTYGLAIQADVAGEPSGVDISSGTFSASALDGSLPGAFQRYNFSITGQVTASSTYWIVAKGTGLTGTGAINIGYDAGNPDATFFKLSFDSGATWGSDANLDIAYEVIGQ